MTDSGFCSYTNPSRATIPLIRPHQCDSEGGRIRGVLLYKVKGNGKPRLPTAERKIRIFSNALGARRRQKKEGEAEEDMAKYVQRRPGRERT